MVFVASFDMFGDTLVGDVLLAPWAVISLVLAFEHVSSNIY